MYFLVEPIRNTFSNVRPCSATLQRALQWASDAGAVPERSLSDPERSRSARATLVARPPTVTTSSAKQYNSIRKKTYHKHD